MHKSFITHTFFSTIIFFIGSYASAQYTHPVYTDSKYKGELARYIMDWNMFFDNILLPDSICVNQMNAIEFNIDTAGNVINFGGYDGYKFHLKYNSDLLPPNDEAYLMAGIDSLLKKTNGHWKSATINGKPCISKKMIILVSFTYFGKCAEQGFKGNSITVTYDEFPNSSPDVVLLGYFQFHSSYRKYSM